jgi:protein-S-isoprenylcysteine O-methyltransferase Ste14
VVVSILFTLFGGPGLVLIFVPYWITRFRFPTGQQPWWTMLACAVIAGGVIPLLDSIRRFVQDGRGTLMPTVPTERLVVTGLYRYVRNPMYAGVLTTIFGEALLFENKWMLVHAAAVWLLIDLFIRRYEEPTLLRRHGKEYAQYCEQVKRWWPRMSPLT